MKLFWDATPQINPREVVWDEKPNLPKGTPFLPKLGENIQSPFSNFAKTTGLPNPVKKIAEFLDLPFRGMTGAGISAGQSIGSAIENVKKGNYGTATLEVSWVRVKRE